MGLNLITPDWPAPGHIRAFCTTRLGGFSHAPFDSFNLGMHVGDDPRLVEANRQMLASFGKIQWLNQVHGNHCTELLSVDAQAVEADASVTRKTGLVCGVMTADCVPVLLCDTDGTVVAAVHAGWRGLANGVIENSVVAMGVEAAKLLAWIGPAISQDCFEVGQDVADVFAGFGTAVKPNPAAAQKYLIDLPAICQHKLVSAGVEKVFQSARCTYGDALHFFSHRRATHQGKRTTGRMLSGIVMAPV